MQGKANFRGHPLHLIAVPFPIAFWSGAFGTDVAGLVTHDPFWFRMSVTLIWLGIAGAALATLFGFIDYYTLTLSKRARVLANRHLVWSVATTAAFPLALLLRARTYDSRAGIALTAAGGILLLIAGYFGSELANRFGAGVRERETPAIGD